MRKWTRAVCVIVCVQWVIAAVLGVMWASGERPNPPTWLCVVFGVTTVGATLAVAIGSLPITRAFSIGVRFGRNLGPPREDPTKLEDASR